MRMMRKYFVAGLLFIVPVTFFIFILYRIFVFMEGIIGGLLKRFLPSFYVPGIGLISLILMIFFFGFLAYNIIGRRVLLSVERFFETLPFVNRLYKLLREVTGQILNREKDTFKKVVKVKIFEDSFLIGFITSEAKYMTGDKYLNVYVPIPNSFCMVIPENKIEQLDISVEDALKTIISMGIFEVKQNPPKE